ncbi:MAG: hypothetical protein R2823_04660 [Acidimicrobiia bacterium]
MTMHERVYRSLLLVFPSDHRAEYGEPMVQLLRDRLAHEGGGIGSVKVWFEVVGDTITSALSERTEIAVDSFKKNWWLAVAVISLVMLGGFGFGMGFEGDQPFDVLTLVFVSIEFAASLAILAGLVIRPKRRVLGSRLIGIGLIPGGLSLLAFWWFPPFILLALVLLAASVAAFIDASNYRRIASEPQPAT